LALSFPILLLTVLSTNAVSYSNRNRCFTSFTKNKEPNTKAPTVTIVVVLTPLGMGAKNE